MLTRTGAFDQAITAGAPQSVSFGIPLRRGVPTRGPIQFLPGATVTIDETQASRYTLAASVANDGTLAPTTQPDALAPYGIELAVYTGIQYADGTQEVLPAGVYRLYSAQMNNLGQIDITGLDRGSVVSNAGNEIPYVMEGSQSLGRAIGRYIQSKYPTLAYTADPACAAMILAPTPTVFPEGSDEDPWSDCMSLANGFGCELFCTAIGGAYLRPIPDITTTSPVWVYTPGAANLALDATAVLDTSAGNVYNIVIVESSGTGIPSPVQGTAEVTDPASPIYPDPDGFGRRPLFFQTSQLGSTEDCTRTAQSILQRYTGRATNPAFSAVPHPAFEAGDVVVYTSTALGVVTTALLSKWTLQLDMLAETAYTCRMAASSLALPLSSGLTDIG
jgi:hypothetical protein